MEIFHSSIWVVMYGCESWTIKKAEWCRIDAFELWCWRRHLRDPWTGRRPNQLILKEINPKYSLEGLMLKLQYFGHLMLRADSLEKTRWENWGQGEKGRQSIIYLDGIINSVDMSLSKPQEMVKDRGAWYAAVHGVTKSWTWLRNTTTTNLNGVFRQQEASLFKRSLAGLRNKAMSSRVTNSAILPFNKLRVPSG